jgi:hypothetical protein
VIEIVTIVAYREPRGLFLRRVIPSVGFGRSRRRACNLIWGRERVGSRLQLGAGVLRDVGEIGRQSWRPNGRRFGLGSIVVRFGHGVRPRRWEANQGRTSFVPLSFSAGSIGSRRCVARASATCVGLGRDAIAAKKVVAPFPQVGTSLDHWRFQCGMWQLGCQFEVRSDGPSTAAAASYGTDSRRRR